MTARLAGKVAVVTGAGRGLGRSEAIALAREGAAVVVNTRGDAADEVVAEIEAAGGSAVADQGDAADWDAAERLVQRAVDSFGRLDILVNNAGINRDQMSFKLDEAAWDDVMRVNLKGHAAPTRFAAAHWRERAKATGAPVDAVVVNTSSVSGCAGLVGQLNYAATKAGILAMTMVLARELGQYGVRANAICPRARTRMTEGRFGPPPDDGSLDRRSPESVAGFVCWLASPAADGVSGQVFLVHGGLIQRMDGWRPGDEITSDQPWSVETVAAARAGLFASGGPGVPELFFD
jgi:3-oxoacyl-[acyl-carrier protein] reductase